ncbi:Ger(x)C family spore germination protein [Mangrovibacillus cuniculi]|uniref:Ger(X)C family spore germination protein n=1 Tax=Mangrovibacillus cuniculi TaxID=2593652 RepID=A0A7S8CDZ0_9BACI|nr:Ger(x)C family spore germination protein [Mangrovibacillus cuniculi]QPC48234.1 Ger(x)C family spore germination protein [Mangrovibacillus cuniculi]
MKKTRLLKLINSLFLLMLLSSCSGKELEHILYVHAIGIDYVDDKYVAFIQFIEFGAIAKQEGGRKEATSNWIGKAEGLSFDMATDHLYRSTQQRVSWGLIKSLIFTERALKQPGLVEEVVDVLNRYNEIRHTIYTFGTSSYVENIFNDTPILNLSPFYSQLSDPEDIYEQYSIIQPIMLHRLLSHWYDSSTTVFIPFLGTNDYQWIEKGRPHSALEMNGIGAITDGKYKGFFERDEVLGLRWVQKGTKRSPVYLYKNNKIVASVVAKEPQAKITYKKEGEEVIFDVGVNCNVSIIEMREPMSVEEITDLTKKEIKKQIREMYVMGLEKESDLLNLEYTLYKNDPNLYNKLSKNEDFFLHKDSLGKIKVDVSILTSGKSKMKKEKNSSE